MFDRFTDRARRVMALARKEAQRFNHDFIGTEHILLGLITEGSGVAANVLKNLDIDRNKIRGELEKHVETGPSMVTAGQLPFTPRGKKVLELALEEATGLGHNYVGTEHLLLALIAEEEGVGAQVLQDLGALLEEVRNEVLELLGADPSEAPHKRWSGDVGPRRPSTPMLDAVAYDLTAVLTSERHPPIVGRDEDVARVLGVLGRRARQNVILVTSSAVQGTLLLYAVAERVRSGAVPSRLEGRRFMLLEPTEAIASVIRGTRRGGSPELALVREMGKERNVILALDHMSQLVRHTDHHESFGAVLGSAIARGAIQCIVIAEAGDLPRLAEQEPRLARRFEQVALEPASETEAVAMLAALRGRYSAYHGIAYSDAALQAAVDLAALYFPEEPRPDRALDLMDDAGSRLSLDHCRRPPELEEISRTIRDLREQRDQAVADQDFERAAEVRDLFDAARATERRMMATWRHERGGGGLVVGEPEIVAAVSRLTGWSEEDIAGRRPPEALP